MKKNNPAEDLATVEGNDEKRIKLESMMTEIVAMLKANDVAGFIVLALPGNTEIRTHLDASWQAIEMVEFERIRGKPDATFQQQANTANVLNHMAAILDVSRDDYVAVSQAYVDSLSMEVIDSEMVRTHKPRGLN